MFLAGHGRIYVLDYELYDYGFSDLSIGDRRQAWALPNRLPRPRGRAGAPGCPDATATTLGIGSYASKYAMSNKQSNHPARQMHTNNTPH